MRRMLRTPVGAAVLATALLLTCTGLLSYWVYTVRAHDEYQETYNAALDARDRLNIVLFHGLSATQTIALCVERGILPRDFATVAPRIASAYSCLDAVELTTGGIVSHVYPYEQNKRALGFNILTDSIQKDEALFAIRNRALIFAGPLNLVQGGLAVVGRGPVFLTLNGEERFWGFTIVIIRVASLMRQAQFTDLESKGFAYKLSKVNVQTGGVIPFFNTTQTLDNPISVKVTVPNGEWILDVAPRGGWSASAKTVPTLFLSIVLSLMGGAFTWYMMRQPAQLQILVNHQTESLLQSQKHLNESLKEKTLLLKEIHHRVKNNLQVISSLLNIQASLIADPRAREGYADSTRRIRSMALVHERLYHTGNLSHIDFREYLNAVAHDLGSSLYRSGVSLQVEAEPIMLGVDTAIPCGLIVNELVSNALKHAFPSEMPGVVSVSFKRINNLMLQLRVEDNGVGIPPEKDWRSLNSMGLNIIRTLAGQISGTMTYDGNSGTRFTIEFPLDERSEENRDWAVSGCAR